MTFSLRTTPAPLAALLLAGVLTACSGDSEDSSGSSRPSSTSSPSSPSGSEPPADASRPSSPGLAVSHIHGLGIDPADGRLFVATHEGVIAVSKDGKPRRVGDTADYMGFTVAGARTFYGSGHPAEGGGGHANRGLIKSTDSGKTWKTVSLGGEVDFHALEYAHGALYGYDSTHGMLRVSKDGTTWDARARLAALDIAVSPEDPRVVLATTESGLSRSTDGGRTFADGAEPVFAYLSWAEPQALYGADPAGGLHRSSDGGKSWTKAGTVPGGRPQALTAVGADRVLAATQDGVYESRDGGSSFTERVPVTAGAHH